MSTQHCSAVYSPADPLTGPDGGGRFLKFGEAALARALDSLVGAPLSVAGPRRANLWFHHEWSSLSSSIDYDRLSAFLSAERSAEKHYPPAARYLPLTNALISQTGEAITALYCKRILFDGTRPLQRHTGAGYMDAYLAPLSDGRIHAVESAGSPEGGMLFRNAMREFVATSLITADRSLRVQTKSPIGICLFPEAPLFASHPLGCVLLGVTEENNARLGAKGLCYDSALAYGEALRELQRAGWIHTALHPGNITLRKDGALPVIHDLDYALGRELDSITFPAYKAHQLIELHYILEWVHVALGENTSVPEIVEGILDGYAPGGWPDEITVSNALNKVGEAVEALKAPRGDVPISGFPWLDRLLNQ